MNQRRSVSILLALFLLASLGTGAITPTAAQEAGAVPTLAIADEDGTPAGAFYAQLEPGESGRIEVTFMVDADDPVEATTTIANVTSAPNGGLALALAGEPLTAPATWLEVDEGPLELEPGEPVARTIDIAVPASTAPGQYVAALALTATDPVPIPDGEGIGQRARATAAIAITVPGEFDTGFTLGDPTLVTYGATGSSALAEIPVENTGAVPVHPEGTLTLEPADDTDPISIPIAMGAVFAGTGTVLSIPLATVPPGDYDLTLALTDPDTNASADLNGIPLTVPETAPGDPAASVAFDRIAVDLEGAPLESVAIEVDVANTGAPIPAATLTLEVSRNGLLVDEVAIAENAALADGVTSFATSYSPEGGYTSGLWTFRLRLESTGPDGAATLLAQSGTIAKIDVP